MLDDDCNAIAYFNSLGRFHNHGDKPNCEVNVDLKDKCTRIYCIVDSKAGEEILVDYGGYEKVNNIDTTQWKKDGENKNVTDKSK
jgi:SET domain-containing protein